MVLISHRYKFIYIKNFKVASTSVEAFFEKFCTEPNKDYKASIESDERITEYGIIGHRCDGKHTVFWNHIPLLELKNHVSEEVFKTYFKFCVVRNPYEKMVSLFHFFRGPIDINHYKSEFEKFVKDKYNYNTNDLGKTMKNKEDPPIFDFFIRYENLVQDIESVCKKLGIEDYDLKKLPTFRSECREKRMPYQYYYTEETKRIVYERHKIEFDYFGYRFDDEDSSVKAFPQTKICIEECKKNENVSVPNPKKKAKFVKMRMVL
jgi:hypothetical protein